MSDEEAGETAARLDVTDTDVPSAFSTMLKEKFCLHDGLTINSPRPEKGTNILAIGAAGPEELEDEELESEVSAADARNSSVPCVFALIVFSNY